ncbi:MAG TPA: NUDIX domain-containing protein [Gaiellaceae bacterium]
MAIGVAPMWLRYLYPTPKLDVRAVAFRGEELLLVRDSADRRWSLPGGWIDLGESLAEAAVHEVPEVAFFDADDLPELSTGRGTHDDLRHMFTHLREPDRACDFA